MSATLQWFSGAELGSTEFDSYSNGGGGAPSHVTSPVRTGIYSLKAPHDGYVRVRNLIGSTTTTFIRCYFKIAAAPTNTVPVLVINNANFASSRGWRIYLTSTGKIGWSFNGTFGDTPGGTGATSFDTAGWNRLEIKLIRDGSVGGMEIYLNGVLQVSDFTHSTTTGTSLTIWNLWFGNDTDQPGTNQSGQDIYWDDMAFATGAYIGAGGSIAVQGKAGSPTYDAWTKNGDTTSKLCWSETPFSNGKNCSDSTPNDRQTMLVDDTALNALVGAGDTINGAMVRAVIKTATSGSVKSTHRIGGVDTDGTDVSLSTVDRVFPSGLNGDPQGIFVDTRANLGAAEIGLVRGATGSGNAVTVEDVWLLVDFALTLIGSALDGSATLALTTAGRVLDDFASAISLALTAAGSTLVSAIQLAARVGSNVTITGQGTLTTSIHLVGAATLSLTAPPTNLIRPLAPLAFSTDASLNIAATQWDADMPDHRPFVEGSDQDRMTLRIGLEDALGGETLISRIEEGWVDEWTLTVGRDALTTHLHGRDPLAAILDYSVRIQYVRDALRGTLGGHLVPVIGSPPQRFLDPQRALLNLPPVIPPGYQRKVGRFSAAMVAADCVAVAGLALSWQVPDYHLLKDFDAVGRIIDVLTKLIDPFVQVEPFKADIFVVGKTVVIRKRTMPQRADFTYSAHDSRIENLTITKRRGPLYGRVHITGAPNKAFFGHPKPGGGTLGESYGYDENGAMNARTTYSNTTRGGDDATILSDQYSYAMADIEGIGPTLVLSSISNTRNLWEPILEDPETGAMLNRPVMLGATTIVQTRDPDTGLIDTTQIVVATNTYDANKFLVGQVTSTSVKNPDTGRMQISAIEYKNNQQGAGGTVQTISKFSGDPLALESASSSLAAGRPFGGPGNQGGGQTWDPYEITTVISSSPLAIDFEYQNDNVGPEIINMLLADLRAASGLYQYTEKFTGVIMPWLQKNVGLHLTSFFSPHTLDVAPEEIALEPALITQIKDAFSEGAKPPVAMADVEAVFWRAT